MHSVNVCIMVQQMCCVAVFVALFTAHAVGSIAFPSWHWESVDVDGGESPNATGAPLHMALDSKHMVSK